MVPAAKRPQFLTAITAYVRWCWQHRVPYRHPDDQVSTVGRKYVHLRDRTGSLARYDLATGEIVITPRPEYWH
jgi:glutamate synthase domain-containing protein 1